MSIGPIYKFPVPKLANGTQATTATDPSTSTIDNIRTKYAEFFGTTGTTGNNGLYGNGLKEVLDVLKTILDGNGKINSADFSATMEYLNGSSFYTEAQTICGKRIDENCREGFLAYRYYLKTIAGIVSNIYSFLEAGRTALAALDGIKDSDKAHVLIIQLEIYEKFIYEAFQSLCTYYQYNADMKQWDQKINFDPDKLGSSTDKNFTTQLYTYSSYNTLSDLRATQINCLDSKGTSTTEGEPKTSKIQLNVFNSISLLDRLRYIRYYYKFVSCFLAEKDAIKDIKLTSSSYSEQYGASVIKDWAKSAKEYTEIKNPDNWTITKMYAFAYKITVYEIETKGLTDLEESFSTLKTQAGAVVWEYLNGQKYFKETFAGMYYRLNNVVEQLTSLENKTPDYSVFPEDVNTGYPCRPDEKSTEATKDTRSLGALEMFYVGYLIDRDGPINAVASFFEVKVAALRNNLSLLSKKITALNTYLDFINRGMDVLNQSQSKKKSRIPDGAAAVLVNICGQKMYNLLEADGRKFLVVPTAYSVDYKKDENTTYRLQGKYWLIPADESGKRFMIGDNGANEDGMGNSTCWIAWWDNMRPLGFEDMENDYAYNVGDAKSFIALSATNQTDSEGRYEFEAVNISGLKEFKLPTQLEVSSIIPGSVKRFESATSTGTMEGLEDNEHTSVIESWTNAFSNKTQYINTAIDTINTDVTVDRSKIDTFDSLTSTFRSRAHDAYTNIASNIRG